MRGVLLVLHCRIGHALVVFILLVFLTRILDLKLCALFPHITCPRLRSRIVDHGIVAPDPFGVLWKFEILLSRYSFSSGTADSDEKQNFV